MYLSALFVVLWEIAILCDIYTTEMYHMFNM